jgi:hypothetical protein
MTIFDHYILEDSTQNMSRNQKPSDFEPVPRTTETSSAQLRNHKNSHSLLI